MGAKATKMEGRNGSTINSTSDKIIPKRWKKGASKVEKGRDGDGKARKIKSCPTNGN